MRILYVCTANICRSASAQQLLLESVAAAPALARVQVLSAGTHSIPDAPGCSVAPALVGHAEEHHSQPLTAELVAWADLILPAARDHRPAIIGLDLASRECTFTIRQAGRIADWLIDAGMVEAARERAASLGEQAVTALDEPTRSLGDPGPSREVAAWADRFAPGDPRRDVEPFPDDPADITRWLIGEMDAARGVTVVPTHEGGAPPRSRRRIRLRRTAPPADGPGDDPTAEPQRARTPDPAAPQLADVPGSHPDDIADPHVLGMGLHPLANQQIRASTDSLTRLLLEVEPLGGDGSPAG